MLDIVIVNQNIKTLDVIDFENYIQSIFLEFSNYLTKINIQNLEAIKYDIEDLFYDLLSYNLIEQHNSTIVNSFLIVIAEQFEKLYLTGAIVEILQYLPESPIKKRLEASVLYLKIDDISTQYHQKFDEILTKITVSDETEEFQFKSINAIINFYKVAMEQFTRIKDKALAKSFTMLFVQNKNRYKLLQNDLIQDVVSKLTLENYDTAIKTINTKTVVNISKIVCNNKKTLSVDQIDNTFYSKSLKVYKKLTFDIIRDVAYKYIQSIGDPQELHEQLRRGEKIIDDEKLLSKYLVSFAEKHKLKLYSAYDEIFDKIKNEKFDIVDWGSGQAIATMLLLDYAEEKDTTLDIENITLIEPSTLALERGLLHIDLLKQKEYKIKTINSDMDCLDSMELRNNSKNKTLHMFSNILDIESFSLDNEFFKKVSNNINNDSIFICVSPNRNDKLNNRLDLFYKYFDENFYTELLSSRDTDIGNTTRYEKIFEVKYTQEETVQEIREKMEIVKSSYQLDIIEELVKYENYVTPILNLELLANSINIDPEYAIFKIRKVAEVLTSKIYSKYENNTKQVSFNDKIRYLSYEKKDFNKTITNYVHTLRTIGNRGVHDNQNNMIKLKLDAHLMVVALISFITELLDKELLN